MSKSVVDTLIGFPAVSVVIPVYKAEAWLHRALDSICAQSLNNWECILVDDGSPDRSGEICDEYAEKDRRFRVIHQKNGGVSSARQAGIDAAKGEYSIHIDPDDWVEPTMLEELYHKAKEDNADMVICDYYNMKMALLIMRSRDHGHWNLIKSLNRWLLSHRNTSHCMAVVGTNLYAVLVTARQIILSSLNRKICL